MARINRDDIDKLYEYGIYLPTRTLIIHGETDVDSAKEYCKGLHILNSQNSDRNITIEMNNVGGDEIHGMAIYDTIRACKEPVVIVVKGHAMSMGSIILQAADDRVMSPNSKLMIHYGTPMLADSEMHAKTQYVWTEECKKFSRWMEDLYLTKIQEKNPMFKRETLVEMLNFDTILTAREAVQLGLADRVLGE